MLRFELKELATAAATAAVVHVAAFVVADVEVAAFDVDVVAAAVANEGAAAAAAAAADAVDVATMLVADVAVDVEGPERVASTGLSHELLLLLQGCE